MAVSPSRRRDALADTPDVLGLLRELVEKQHALERRVALLEQAGRNRDAADGVLRRQLADSTQGLAFTAADLLRHAALDDALADALRGADVVTVVDLGCWCRDHAGLDDGVAIVRLRNRCWQVQHIICAE